MSVSIRRIHETGLTATEVPTSASSTSTVSTISIFLDVSRPSLDSQMGKRDFRCWGRSIPWRTGLSRVCSLRQKGVEVRGEPVVFGREDTGSESSLGHSGTQGPRFRCALLEETKGRFSRVCVHLGD